MCVGGCGHIQSHIYKLHSFNTMTKLNYKTYDYLQIYKTKVKNQDAKLASLTLLN